MLFVFGINESLVNTRLGLFLVYKVDKLVKSVYLILILLVLGGCGQTPPPQVLPSPLPSSSPLDALYADFPLPPKSVLVVSNQSVTVRNATFSNPSNLSSDYAFYKKISPSSPWKIVLSALATDHFTALVEHPSFPKSLGSFSVNSDVSGTKLILTLESRLPSLQASNFPSSYPSSCPNCTFEGANYDGSTSSAYWHSSALGSDLYAYYKKAFSNKNWQVTSSQEVPSTHTWAVYYQDHAHTGSGYVLITQNQDTSKIQAFYIANLPN